MGVAADHVLDVAIPLQLRQRPEVLKTIAPGLRKEGRHVVVPNPMAEKKTSRRSVERRRRRQPGHKGLGPGGKRLGGAVSMALFAGEKPPLVVAGHAAHLVALQQLDAPLDARCVRRVQRTVDDVSDTENRIESLQGIQGTGEKRTLTVNIPDHANSPKHEARIAASDGQR